MLLLQTQKRFNVNVSTMQAISATCNNAPDSGRSGAVKPRKTQINKRPKGTLHTFCSNFRDSNDVT